MHTDPISPNGISTARGKNHDELLDYLAFVSSSLNAFATLQFKWKNDTFDLKKGAKFMESIAAKALSAKKQNSGKIAAEWIFQDWNEFKFQGNLSDAKISTQ